MKAVHFGAGNIGRGFIGAVLYDNQYDVCFVDVNQTLITELNQHNEYEMAIIGSEEKILKVKRVSALNSTLEGEKIVKEIVDADLITTSVGVANLEKIAGLLARGLQARAELGKKIDIIANENAINATDILMNEITKVRTSADMDKIHKYVGFVNSAIDRQALTTKYFSKDIPLVEPYFEWVVDKSQMKNDLLPKIKGITYVDDLQPYIERKLYLVNAGHAVAAYVGKLFDYPTVQEALSDSRISAFVLQLMLENAKYLVAQYGLSEAEITNFIEKTLKRHKNPQIKDSVARVGRSPIRKIGRDERIVAPINKLCTLGIEPYYGKRALVALLQYSDPADAESVALGEYIEANGIVAALAKYSQLTNSILAQEIELLSKEIELDKTIFFERRK